MTKRRNNIDISELKGVYIPPLTMWTDATTDIVILRDIVRNLKEDEKNAIIYYAECGSLRKLGEQIGVSVGTVQKYINNIKKKIKNEYRKRTEGRKAIYI